MTYSNTHTFSSKTKERDPTQDEQYNGMSIKILDPFRESFQYLHEVKEETLDDGEDDEIYDNPIMTRETMIDDLPDLPDGPLDDDGHQGIQEMPADFLNKSQLNDRTITPISRAHMHHGLGLTQDVSSKISKPSSMPFSATESSIQFHPRMLENNESVRMFRERSCLNDSS